MKDFEIERLERGITPYLSPAEEGYLRTMTRQKRAEIPVDITAALADPGGASDVMLLPDDSLIVAPRRMTVRLAGNVRQPGLLAWSADESFMYYVEQAGGFSWNANDGDVRLIRGESGLWLEPDDDTLIEPGDTIFVPDRSYVSKWVRFKEIVLLASQIATVALVILSM